MNLSDETLRIVASLEMNINPIGHHLDSINDFYDTGIPQICTDTFAIDIDAVNPRKDTEEDRDITKITVSVVVTDVTLHKPTMRLYKSGRVVPLTPSMARKNNRNYSSPLRINAKIHAVAYRKSGATIEKDREIKNYQICRVPTMIGSKLCHTYNASREEKIKLEEDPTDLGGYFIIGGVEWVVILIENIKYNVFHAYHNKGYKKELARGEIISKPGDAFENSSEIIITLYANNQLCCKLINIRMHKDNTELDMPFYVVFRLLGITSDEEMFSHITYKDSLNDKMVKRLIDAMECKYPQLPDARNIYTQSETIQYLSEHLDTFKKYYEKGQLLGDDENILNKKQYINKILLNVIDKYFLPHIGTDEQSRYVKARFFGHLINRLLLVEMGKIPSTDRDSYANKRIHPTGISFSKAFKTQYNFAFVQKIKRAIMKEIQNTQFNTINWERVVTQSITEVEFEKSLAQAITTSGTVSKIGNAQFKNHLSTQQLHRKNPLNVLSTLRQISSPNTTSAKASARADIMRRVHSSYPGYICPVQSADTGENVGMYKQLAISSRITNIIPSIILKTMILEDDLFIHIDDTTSEDITLSSLSKVFVNGEWIGLTAYHVEFVEKYIMMRRESKINIYTSIVQDILQREIHLWVDVGRILQPLLIVENNYNPRKLKDFTQGIKITPQILMGLYSGKYDIHDLLKMQIIEYISPEESETLLVARSYKTLMENQKNYLAQFTHCEIPQMILGIAALTSPFSHCNQLARVCYQTNQVKQTGSWFSLNWRHRSEKETFLQYYNQIPLVRTMSNNYMTAFGNNVIVAIMCFGGFNQEDSLLMNKSAIKRGLYTGTHFSFEKTILERGESLGMPNIADTSDIKANANYNKLVDGIIPVGTVIVNNDVVIGKRVECKDEGAMPFIDKSIVYRGNETAIVENVIVGRNQDDATICKVVYRTIRPVSIGDKFSSRAGQKGVCGMQYQQEDMPFTSNGLCPDIIMNPHSIPSRMTVGQLIEGIVAKNCALKGVVSDGTVFNNIDIDETVKEIHKTSVCLESVKMHMKKHPKKSLDQVYEDIGYRPSGYERMYNPETGRRIETSIFITPTFYQRLQKFVADAVYAVSTGPTDAITRQPVSGKASGGGLRLGEMEHDVCIADGAVAFLQEKFVNHSDEFIIYICATCGSRDSVIVNHNKSIYKCNHCGDLAKIVKVLSAWSTKLFMQEMRGMNIKTSFDIKTPKFEKHL